MLFHQTQHNILLPELLLIVTIDLIIQYVFPGGITDSNI